MELNEVLSRTAERIVAEGTAAALPSLEAMAEATAALNPGAAAAMVDWDGPEIARLRAFGVVHGIVLRELSPNRQGELLRQLQAIAPVPVPVDRGTAPVLAAAGAQRFAHVFRPLNWNRIRA